VSAVTGGRDALGEVTVRLELDGNLASGQGVSTDILEASGRAYLRALAIALGETSPAREAERHLEREAAGTPTP
jgi:2-isopropylmalate synthase